MFRRAATRFALLGWLAWGLATPVNADTISIAWDDLNDPNVDIYRVYYGTSPANYSQTQDVASTVTQTVLSGLSSCTDYYVSVKAVASDGTESVQFADEIAGWARPIVSSAVPSSIQRGATHDVTITGANFRAGVTVTTSHPDITVSGVTVQGCNQLTATLVVAANAAVASFDVTVTDANGILGTGSGVAGVTTDATAPVISGLQAGSVGSTSATISWTTDEPADGQVFFRETGETVYQQTAVVTALSTSHAVVLNGMTPQTTYEYYVESSDAGGNSATQNGATTFATTSNNYNYLRFEPENRPLTSPAEAVNGAGAFANGWMQIEQGTPVGSAGNPAGSWDFGFSVPSSATWHVWLRMYGVNGNANEWFESVNGGSLASVQPAANGSWQWVAARSWSLLGGTHTLTLAGAEARARIDRVLITDDPNFIPTEQPGSDVVPPTAPSGVVATPADTQVSLAWTNSSSPDLDRIVVRYRTDGITPVSPVDGQGLIDRAATSGSSDGVTHSGLTNGVTISYALFAIDSSGNASPPVPVDETPANQQQNPPPAQVQNLRRTDNQ